MPIEFSFHSCQRLPFSLLLKCARSCSFTFQQFSLSSFLLPFAVLHLCHCNFSSDKLLLLIVTRRCHHHNIPHSSVRERNVTNMIFFLSVFGLGTTDDDTSQINCERDESERGEIRSFASFFSYIQKSHFHLPRIYL